MNKIQKIVRKDVECDYESWTKHSQMRSTFETFTDHVAKVCRNILLAVTTLLLVSVALTFYVNVILRIPDVVTFLITTAVILLLAYETIEVEWRREFAVDISTPTTLPGASDDQAGN